MRFKHFYRLYEKANYDEIKVIGKEIEREGKVYHFIGMTLKDKKANLYILEFAREPLEAELREEKTPRESMKSSMYFQKHRSLFLHIREVRSGGKVYETAGASSGSIQNDDGCEFYMFFSKMFEAGWKVPGESVFYDVPWENLCVTNIELREEMDCLPNFERELEVLTDVIPDSYAIEKPVLLECGKNTEIEFQLKDGSKAVCYINKIDTMDVWEDSRKKFADRVYREKMLQHMTEMEFEEMKNHFFTVLAEHCPEGKHYMTVEYECSQDMGLTFYDKESLDIIPEPKMGGASALLMTVKPDKETGPHGLKLRGCVIQKILEAEEKKLEAELFSYSELVQKKVESLW